MYVLFINNKTGEQTYNRHDLPILVREMYFQIFDKLYFKYCQ
jgi:hypothetical protein